MRIVITGGAGFLGTRLARKLLERGSLVDAAGKSRPLRQLVLLDVAAAAIADPRVTAIAGDLADPAVIERVVTPDTDSIFHLAAVVSGQAEAEFDTGMRVNLDATRALLERCRRLDKPPKFVFTSSLAVFGGKLPDPVPDDAPLTPQTSYGAQKAIGELLVYDMTRKGYIDGRSLRLPTVTVRPGKPNKAASSFASGIIREPLSGVDAVCPVAPETELWITSPRQVVDNLLVGHDVAASKFGQTRSVNVPGLRISVGAMVDALRRVAGDAVAARVRWQIDPVIDRIVQTWPPNFAPRLGPALGMGADTDFDDSRARSHRRRHARRLALFIFRLSQRGATDSRALHRRNQVLRTRSPARDDPDRIGERHVHRVHPLPIENVDRTRERRRDRRDEDGVAPVLELLDDEPRDKGIFDLDQRGPPGALAAVPRHLVREAADDPIARDSLEDGPLEPFPSPPSDASTDGGADDGADRENEQQRQELFGGNPIGENRSERPHQIGDRLHPLEQQQDRQIHRHDNKQTSSQRFRDGYQCLLHGLSSPL